MKGSAKAMTGDPFLGWRTLLVLPHSVKVRSWTMSRIFRGAKPVTQRKRDRNAQHKRRIKFCFGAKSTDSRALASGLSHQTTLKFVG